MPPRSLLIFIFLTIIAIVFTACKGGSDKSVELAISKIQIPQQKIQRYDSALFFSEIEPFEQKVKSLIPDFGIFITDTNSNSAAFLELHDFYNDPVIRNTAQAVNNEFSDLQTINERLTSLFRHLKYYFPQFRIPEVYTYISGYDAENPILYADSILIIGLDNYLGSQYPFYVKLNFPKYRIARMSREYIIRDCATALSEYMLMMKPRENRFIDRMIHEGKKLYFLNRVIPGTADTIISGYTEAQLKWCRQYEKNIWAYIIDSKLMYSTDQKSISRLFNDGPYSNDFGTGSAPRIAVYTGWQIVSRFMEKNPEYSLADLMNDTDSQKILTLSKYKP